MVYKAHHKRIRTTHCFHCGLKLKTITDNNAVCEDCTELGLYDVAG